MDKNEWMVVGHRSINLNQVVFIEYRASGQLWLHLPRIEEDKINLITFDENETAAVIERLEAAGVTIPPRPAKSRKEAEVH